MNHAKVTTTLLMLIAVVLCSGPVGLAEPVGTAFTYQGRLIDANQAADGLYDFQFKLFDAVSDGNKLGLDVNAPEVDVIDGYFTVELDFGSVFDGNNSWLDIGVRPGGLEDPNLYTFLTPRQQISPTPYALYALNGGGAGSSPWQASGSDIYYNDGNVGISTTSPAAKLEVAGQVKITGGSPAVGKVLTSDSVGLATWQNPVTGITGSGTKHYVPKFTDTYSIGTSVIYVSSEDGYVGISVNDPTEALDVYGTARLRGIGSSTGTTVVADDDGKLWKLSSSKRYKTNIETLDTGADAVLKLRPVRFEYKETGQKDIGLIAEEVEKISPDLVIYDGQGRPDAVKYDKVALYLLSVLKDQQKENEDIKKRLTDMESQMTKLSLKQEGGVK